MCIVVVCSEMKEERDEDGVIFFFFRLSSEPLLLSEFWRVWSFFLSFSFSLSSVKHQCVGNVKREGEAKEGGKGVNPMKVYDEGSSILAPFPGGRRI